MVVEVMDGIAGVEGGGSHVVVVVVVKGSSGLVLTWKWYGSRGCGSVDDGSTK